MTVSEAKKLFLLEQQIRNNSKQTILSYKKYITYFEVFCNDCDLTKISLKMLQGYYLHLKLTHSANSISLQTYIRHLRAFLSFLHEEKLIDEDFLKRFKLPKAEKQVIKILSKEQIDFIIKNDDISSRDKLIMLLFIDTGIRANELLNIKVTDINVDSNIILVNGKGFVQRLVSFGNLTKKYLILYINDNKSNKYLFEYFKQKLTYSCLASIMRRNSIKFNIPELKCHRLRHTFATNFIMNNGNCFALQQLLGHTTLDMSKKYMHLAQSHTISNYIHYSPIDNINKD